MLTDFAVLDAWASTIPHDCVGCAKPHVHVGDLCAVPRCQAPLPAGVTVYAVLSSQTGVPDGPPAIPCRVNPALTTAQCHHAEQWVCWRHIRPGEGPV
jgi:hypothetical protein